MATINKNYNKLDVSYFFLQVTKKAKDFLKENPGVTLYKLGIGNTTQALPPAVIAGLETGVKKLGNIKTYTGYGDEQGDARLREALAKYYGEKNIKIDPLEIFISDGAKTDCANILSIFSDRSIVCIQNPVYPVYVDSAIIAGKKVVFIKAGQSNGFVPKPPRQKVDLIYIASPNNPTGAVFSKGQLKEFVDYALKNKAVIIFDAAYAQFVQDKNLPGSIFEIEGAKECAIEINSFSKWAGFTGVRLGWAVVPMDLRVEDVNKGKVNSLWNRRQTTMFNGACNIAQEGGLAVLSPEGQKECKKIIDYYMGNAKIIREGLVKMGLRVFGGDNAPYIWLKVPDGLSSWEFFDKLLRQAHVLTIPGNGFGAEGEGYMRLSAFGDKEDTIKAIKSIEENLKI